jgi:hypothetical protein
VAIALPLHAAFDPVAFGSPGMDRFEPLVAQRWQALASFAHRFHHLRIPPPCRSEEQGPLLGLHATQRVQIDRATIRPHDAAP